MARFKIVMTDDRHKTYDEEKSVLKEIDAELVIANCVTPEDVIKECRDADGILVNLAPINSDVIAKLDKCRIIARYGVGFDNIDVSASTRKGVYVANVPDASFEEVSDQALALMMACIRKVARRDAQVRQGKWNIGKSDPVYRMVGKTFTLLGFGVIARSLYRKIAGFNFSQILVFDPFVDEAVIASMGAKKADWETAIRQADYISVHIPLSDKTRGIINAGTFAMMKKSAIIVNTSRGPVIDESALLDALTTGEINSAGLDVHTREPLDSNSPFMKLENCVLTDHSGWYSEEAMSELKTKAAQNVRDVLLGKAPKYPVNKIN
jgi:D-3-phosphoglycerate dehydrogenase / 2-oxoglutarate reductase